jgi:hypothetical protein
MQADHFEITGCFAFVFRFCFCFCVWGVRNGGYIAMMPVIGIGTAIFFVSPPPFPLTSRRDHRGPFSAYAMTDI